MTLGILIVTRLITQCDGIVEAINCLSHRRLGLDTAPRFMNEIQSMGVDLYVQGN